MEKQCNIEELLYSAVETNNDLRVQSLLEEGADVNWHNRSAFSYTPLIKASQKGNIKIMGLLLNAGADVHQTDRNGYSSLMCAAYYGHEECVDLLLKAGADVNTGDRHYYTAAIYASQKGHDKCVKLLLKAGADVNAHNNSALFYAVSKGYYKALDVLINAGADVNGENWRHRTALIEAVSYYRSDTSSSSPPRHYRNCVELLLQAGADVNQTSSQGMIAISIASRVGFDVAVELLIQSGADVNKIGQYQCSPLMEAVAIGQVKCAKQLLEAGADVNFIHHSGVTPLMCVGIPLLLLFKMTESSEDLNYPLSDRNFLSCAKLLLQLGAKINLRAKINIRNSTSNNSLKLQMAPHNDSSDRSDICLLLYAAGETIDGSTDAEKLPDCLKFKALKLNLKHLCREGIRNHLLDLDPHTHLFGRIPQLGLPSLLTEFLLYDAALQYE